MRTPSLKKGEIPKQWLVVDAEGKVLGRLASEVATLLLGKAKPEYTPHVESGDNVVVINASKVHLSGNKADTKAYTHHTLYYGGFRSVSYRRLLEKHPDEIIRRAVWGMLPKGRQGRSILKNLFVYPGAEHPHVAQRPDSYTLKG
jgi:large subunit ribosomal protein L13